MTQASKEELAEGIKLDVKLQQLEQAANSDPDKKWMVPSIKAARMKLKEELLN